METWQLDLWNGSTGLQRQTLRRTNGGSCPPDQQSPLAMGGDGCGWNVYDFVVKTLETALAHWIYMKCMASCTVHYTVHVHMLSGFPCVYPTHALHTSINPSNACTRQWGWEWRLGRMMCGIYIFFAEYYNPQRNCACTYAT